MEISAMEQYWVWLSSVDGVGPKRFAELLDAFGSAQDVWDAARSGDLPGVTPKMSENLRACATTEYFFRLFDKLESMDVTPVTQLSDNYSELLRNIPAAPTTLYVRGNADLNLINPFAIVGTRAPSYEGKRTAEEFALRLAMSGATVVSGLARGVDTCAHGGCLRGGGKTVAVLGCGIDKIYPSENKRLAEEILENGGSIISEYHPGSEPTPGNFPARNRIISGLSRGTLLVEGGAKSGGLITMDYAVEQGRDLFAVPGSIYSTAAQAPNAMLMRGALPVISPWDIPEHYGWAKRPEPVRAKKQSGRKKAAAEGKQPEQMHNPMPGLNPDEAKIVEILRVQPLSLGELRAETGLNAANLSSLLTMLEIRGIICKTADAIYHIVV